MLSSGLAGIVFSHIRLSARQTRIGLLSVISLHTKFKLTTCVDIGIYVKSFGMPNYSILNI